MKRLAIFDLDGTLADSLQDLTAATNHVRRRFGMDELTMDEVRRLVGQGARRLLERAIPDVSGEDFEQALAEFLDYNDRHLADATRLYPGAAETLAELERRNVTLALISNKNVALCRKLLETFGIARFFRAIVGADSLPQRKPSPEPLLLVMRELGFAADETVMIGDSINDIAAGRGAGAGTVGCAWGYGDDAELAGASFRIGSLPELLDLPPMKPDATR